MSYRRYRRKDPFLIISLDSLEEIGIRLASGIVKLLLRRLKVRSNLAKMVWSSGRIKISSILRKQDGSLIIRLGKLFCSIVR